MRTDKIYILIFAIVLMLFLLPSIQATAWDVTSGTSHVFNHDGSENSLSQIDSTHYLNAYAGLDYDGYAIVLTVNQTDWTITSGAKYEFDADYEADNSLIQIDSTHYLNVYAGLGGYDGYAIVLIVNETDWTITSGAKHDFDTNYAFHHSLSQIDSTHYLNAYAGLDYDGYAIVLTVNQTDWTITSGAKHEFDTANGEDNSLIQIDSTHYLNAYQGSGNDGYAVVLTVDNSTWTITSGAKHEFDNISAVSNSLSQIDSTHYLNAYFGGAGDAVILTVNQTDWTITSGAKSEFGTASGSYNSLIQIDSSHYLNTYRPFPPFYARVLTVNKADWAITSEANYEVGWSYGFSSLSKIDSSHYLTTYTDAASYGRATVLIIELPGAFNSTWNTSKIGVSNSTSIKLPLESDGIYNFVADWGDGTNDTITLYNQSEVTHNYGVEGTYNVSITGEIVGFRFNDGGDKLKITDISNWGILRVGNNNGYFYGCSNLNSSATDSLDLTGTTDLSYMFRGASAFNGNISSWNTSSVTDMHSMFFSAHNFNQNISDWNTSSVTIMYSMFYDASAFNQDISLWDVSGVTYMHYMFASASAFNGNISSWDVSSVTNMGYMFYIASAFNQDLTEWCVRNIASEPTNFAVSSALTEANKPVWGTCVSNHAPTTPTLTNPVNNSYINSIIMNWTASTDADGDTVNYYVMVNGTQACYTTDLNCSYNPADGYYEWNVTPYDGLVNGTTSDSRYYTYDTINPAYSNVGKNDTTIKVNDIVKFYTQWTDANPAYYIFSWNESGLWVNDTAEALTEWSNITKTITATGKPTVGWRIYANDTTNNLNNTGIQTFTVANTAPTASTLIHPGNDSIMTGINITLNWTTSIDVDLDAITYYVYFSNSTPVIYNTSTNNLYQQYTNLEDAETYYWYIVSGDGTDNTTSLESQFQRFNIDTTAPEVLYVNPTPIHRVRQTDNWIYINTTATHDTSDIDTCTLTWNSVNYTMTKVGTGTSVSCYYNMTTIDGTNYTYKVTAKTIGGGVGSPGIRTNMENTAPEINLTLANSSDVTSTAAPLTWVGTDNESDSLTYYVYGNSTRNSTLTQLTSTSAESYSWTVDDGTYYWYSIAGDSYENTTSLSYQFNAKVPPVLTGLRKSVSTVYALESFTIYANCSDTGSNVSSVTVSVYSENDLNSPMTWTNYSMSLDTGNQYKKVYTPSNVGNYNISFYCSDYYNYKASSESALTFTAQLAETAQGGSGGSKEEPEIIFVEEGNFSVETEFGSNYYNWVAVPESIKTGKIIIKNLGLEKATVKISCVPLTNETNIDICSFVTFDRTENIEIYPGGKLEEIVKFNVTIPKNISYGESLIFGIIVTDQEGHKSQPLHVETKIGRFIGFLSLFFEKMFSGFYTIPFSKYKSEAQDVTIPYLIPAIFATMIFGFITSFIVRKIRFKNKFLSNIKVGLNVLSIFAFFIVFLIMI